jgi:hypothetical protein
MKKISLVLLLLSSFNAFSENIVVDTNSGCSFNTEIPKKPIQFTKYYSLDEYNDDIENYNKNLNKYIGCVSDFIDALNTKMDEIESIGRKEVEKTKNFKALEYIKE